jgi:hypothetical protein
MEAEVNLIAIEELYKYYGVRLTEEQYNNAFEFIEPRFEWLRQHSDGKLNSWAKLYIAVNTAYNYEISRALINDPYISDKLLGQIN